MLNMHCEITCLKDKNICSQPNNLFSTAILAWDILEVKVDDIDNLDKGLTENN